MTSKHEALFAYGSAANVRLSMAELGKLKLRLSPDGAEDWIEKLSLWKAAKGMKTKSDYYTILMWARKDGERMEVIKDDPPQGTHLCEMCPKPHQWISADPIDCSSYEMACPEFRSILTKRK